MHHFGIFVITLVVLATVNGGPMPDTTTGATDDTTTISPDLWKDGVICSSNGTLSLKQELIEKFGHCMPTSEHYGTGEGQKNPNCAIFCQAKAANLFGEDGLPTKDLYDTFTDLAFPEAVQEKAKEHAHTCIDEFASKIDPTDETCEGAGEYEKCINKIWQMAC